jgi:hypothetical protein
LLVAPDVWEGVKGGREDEELRLETTVSNTIRSTELTRKEQRVRGQASNGGFNGLCICRRDHRGRNDRSNLYSASGFPAFQNVLQVGRLNWGKLSEDVVEADEGFGCEEFVPAERPSFSWPPVWKSGENVQFREKGSGVDVTEHLQGGTL